FSFSPNSRYFLSASEDKHVVLFWYDEVYPVRVYAGHSMEAINCVRFHPNCSYFASASSDGNLFLFKINYDSCPVRMYRKHIAKVYTLAFSPCGKQLASAGMYIFVSIIKSCVEKPSFSLCFDFMVMKT
ncbi:TAF5-like RNA polymerase II p300/CBP-associated factor-associated factor subunit 5L, partial [Araneus ventricosus]